MAGEYFASLGINLVEAEDDGPDDGFRALAMRRSESLSVGVEAEQWEGESVGGDDVGNGAGYMTVGESFNFDAAGDADAFADDDGF